MTKSSPKMYPREYAKKLLKDMHWVLDQWEQVLEILGEHPRAPRIRKIISSLRESERVLEDYLRVTSPAHQRKAKLERK